MYIVHRPKRNKTIEVYGIGSNQELKDRFGEKDIFKCSEREN